MGEETFVHFQQAIVNAMENRSSTVLGKDKERCDHKDDEPSCQGRTASACDEALVVPEDAPGVDEVSTHQGKLILDATVAEQAIRFPTDLSLLNEGREISEQIIDVLHALLGRKTKPRTYRQTARKDTWPL